jgi:secreted trypsin-like serine protease
VSAWIETVYSRLKQKTFPGCEVYVRFNRLLTILIAPAVFGCSATNSTEHADSADLAVVSGEELKAIDSVVGPTVSLTIRGEEIEECSGVLIASDIVLSSAHCFIDSRRDVRVGFGLKRDRKAISVRSLEIHPSFHPNKMGVGNYDVAVLRLRKNAPANIPRAQLRAAGVRMKVGDVFVTSGFGSTDGSEDGGNGRLHKAALQIKSLSAIETRSAGLNSKSSVCHGDSGGPAFVFENNRWFLWGINKGVSVRNCSGESIHFELASIHPWLNSAVARLRANK